MNSPPENISVSVVIPTRNRAASLKRCVASLMSQTYPLSEVIVVDASDSGIQLDELAVHYPKRGFQIITSIPSVCIQRNTGVRVASSTHILVCDDDIELPPEYVEVLVRYLSAQRSTYAITGTILERSNNGFVDILDVPLGLSGLLWRFVFQLSVWTDVEKITAGRMTTPLLGLLKSYYRRRRNGLSNAGWPLVTQVEGEAFQTAAYGLGAAMFPRDLLITHPYDERLGPHGIGDNYGLALSLPDNFPITVLRGVCALHHKEETERLPRSETYFLRILALDFFMGHADRFGMSNRLFLIWSLAGNFVSQLMLGRLGLAFATCRACYHILLQSKPIGLTITKQAATGGA